MKATTTSCLMMCLISLVFVELGCTSTSITKSSTIRHEDDGLPYRRTAAIDKVWLADSFDFSGFEVLLIEAPNVVGVIPKDDKEQERLNLAIRTLPRDLCIAINQEGIFNSVSLVSSESEHEAQILIFSASIIEYSRGSSAARFGLGYGAGMPYIKVKGEARHNGKVLFKFHMDKKGHWFGTSFQSSEDIQNSVSHELAEDVAKFMGRVARHEFINYKD